MVAFKVCRLCYYLSFWQILSPSQLDQVFTKREKDTKQKAANSVTLSSSWMTKDFFHWEIEN